MLRLVGRPRSYHSGGSRADAEKPTFQGTESVGIRGLATLDSLRGAGLTLAIQGSREYLGNAKLIRRNGVKGKKVENDTAAHANRGANQVP